MNSNLSFVIGLVTIHFVICKLKNKNDCQLKDVLLIIIVSITSYIININYFPPYGMFEGYNIPGFQNLYSVNLFNNIFIFSIYFLHCAWVPTVYFFNLLLINKKNSLNLKSNLIKAFKIKSIYDYLLLILLASFAMAPYLLVNRAPLFIFSEYFQRHSYLLAPIFGIFFAILFRDINNISFLKEKKFLKFYLIIFLCQNLLLLSYGHYKKIERYVYQENLINELKIYGKIPKGNVKIISNNYPTTLRSYEISHIFFKAYNSASWYGDHVRGDKKKINWLNKILQKEEYRLSSIVKDYVYECSSFIYLKNDLTRIERIKNFYIMNGSNFFNIQKIIYDCDATF